MLKKLLLTLLVTAVSLFAINFQTASKEELMKIKGIGEKRATAIIKYRKTHRIKSASDLKAIPGIGDEIANNAARGIQNGSKKVKSLRSKTSKKIKTTKAIKKQDKKTKIKKDILSKPTKTKAKKRVKKRVGSATKRAEKRAKSKAKKSLKKLKK